SVLATCNGISLPTEENMFHVQILNLNPGKTYQFDINNDGTPDVTGVTGVSLWTTAGQTGWPMAFSNGIGSDTIGVDTTNNGIINQTFIAHEILCTDIDGDNTVDNNTALCNTATVPEGEIIAQAAPYNGNNVYKYILTDANGIVFNPIVANYSGHFTGLLSGDYKVYAYNFVDTTDANLFCDSLIAGATDLDTVTSSLCVGVCGSAAYMVDCFICPDISLLTPSTTSLCFDDPMLDLTASIAMLHNSENGSTDFDVEFVYFTTQQLTAADVYNTPAGVLGTYDVTAGSITAASLTGATLPQTAGTYYIYARLLPAPVDLTCRPYAETMVSVADQIVFGAPFALQNPTCPGDANGAIDLTNSVTEGSNSPTAYNWTTIPTGAIGSGPFAFGPEGTYTVQVTFASGCTATNSYTLTDPDSLNITAVLTDPLCNNGTDGSIDITVTGGTAPYGPFDWNDGSFFTEDLTNISAGFYSVGVLDANGCNANASFTLNNPPAIVITATTLSANPCPGDSVASIDLTVSGGTEILDTISDLIISEYGEGSSNNKWVEIYNGTGSPVDLSDYEIWRVSNGGTWPEATISLSGTLNHNSSFLISNTGADTALTNISNLTSGTLSHSGDDAIGLAKLSVLIDAVGEDGPDPGTAWDVAGVTNGTKEHTLIRKSTILSPNTNWTMSAGTNTTDSEWIVLAQNNFSNAGSHTFTPSVSVPPYLYSWSNGASVEDINDLHDGIYTVTVTDGNGCTETASYDVTGIDSIPPTVICQDVTVYLGLTGSATVTTGDIDNGSFDDCPGALIFELEQTLFTCADLGQNQIKLTVTDSFANVDSCIATITVLDTITRSICTMVSQASSCGTNDGSATVLGNGVGPFTYMWDNGETTATAVALTAGAHTVIVTDNGIACSDTCEVTVTGPTLLAISCNVDANVTCNGNSDGAASVSVTGGIQPYIFSWTSGSVTGSATNLIAGTYTVSVTDQSGCTLTCSVTITEPTKLLATATWTDVSCNGAADGTATVVPSGGIPPYTYLWNDPLAQTSATATGLSGGNYIVTITDSNMCITTVGVPIFEPAPLANSPTVVQPLCNGDANGKITAIITGGTAPYIYTWSNGASTEINDNLITGQYILTVTDSNNCVLVDTIVVDEPNLFDVSVTPETILCAGDSNANIVVNVIGGGTPPYAFLWNTSPAQTTASASNLSAGTYQLIITDDNGCDTVITAVVNENDPISVSPIIADVSCNGGNDGAIAILISGGAPAASGYNIIWSNGVTTQSNSGITAGTYTVTIGDSLGCEYVDSFVVAEPPALVLATSSDSVSCSGFSDGAAFVQVSGGTPPYAILWNDPLMQNTGSATNLVAGTYTVTVLDANNCTQSASVTVGEPSAVDGTSSVTNVSCNGGSDGSITVTPSGGTPGYTYMWSNGETTQTVSGLSAADYTVTITDANGCQKVLVITVSEPNELACTEVITDVLCHGDSTGAILVTVSGGTPGYSYIWSNGDNGPLADSLSVGTYILTVTDANGCTKSSSYTLTQPDLLMTTTSQSNVSCKGGNDGTATVVVGGGVSPYSYSWSTSPVQTTNYVNGLSAGTYYVTITDANGCSIVDSVTLVQPSELLAFFLPTNPSCSGESDGSIDVLVGGGVGPYTYMWSNGASTEDVSGLAAGIHYVMIMDAHGCATMAIIYLTDLPPVQLTTAVMNVACNGNSSGMATAFATGGTGTFTYLWSDGQTSATATGLNTGTYTVTVFDGNACTATSTVSISSASALSC
ncbi:MAG: hypothetical protein HKO56_04745, partial [Bacteroidia bacterium]|nr:hypothetical protein [Bacteroidia bacterium]